MLYPDMPTAWLVEVCAQTRGAAASDMKACLGFNSVAFFPPHSVPSKPISWSMAPAIRRGSPGS